MRHHLGLAAILLAGLSSSAYANTITWSAQEATSTAPFTLLSIPASSALSAPDASGNSSVSLGNGVTATVSESSTSTPYGGIYDTSITNIAASPISGTSTANYLVAEPNHSVTISYATSQSSFDLLWGSVDSYNDVSINFCGTAGCSVLSSITGQNLLDAPYNITTGTSAFVEFTDTDLFTSVTLSTTGIAFEFVPAVPEPVTFSILATGLVGLAVAKRRRQQLSKR